MQAARATPAGPLQKVVAPGPPTTKDGGLAADVIGLRTLLLQAPEVRARLDDLDGLRPIGHSTKWVPREGLKYHVELGRGERDLDYAWTQAELDAIIARWSQPGDYGSEWLDLPYRDQTRDGTALVGVGFMAGRPDAATGRPSRMVPAVIEMVARSIALHAAGHSWARADETAADEYCAKKDAVAVYRKRLRDRLADPVVSATTQPKLRRTEPTVA